MLGKIIHFIKYNNAAIIILAVILILGASALAAGPENIGQKQSRLLGLDNTVLLAADLAAFNMDFKIENIQADEKYYYVTYSYLDIAVADSAWQYQLSQRTQKISKKIKEDIGVYMAKFLAKHYEARIRVLTNEKALAESQGEQRRIEVIEYSGLVGRTLDLAAKVFPGYEAVKKIELPAPDLNPPTPLLKGGEEGLNPALAPADNLTKIYNDYVAAHDGDADGVLDAMDNCPGLVNPDQLDSNANGYGDACDGTPAGEAATSTPDLAAPLIKGDEGGLNADASSTPPIEPPAEILDEPAIPEPDSVDIIELPPPADEPAPEPVIEPTPEPAPTEAPQPEAAPAPEAAPIQ